jgi:hypothetical protein
VRDIVGLYLNPPDKAIVLSVDEKSQIQALDPAKPAASAQHRRPGSRATNGVLGSEAPASVGSPATQIVLRKSRRFRRTLFAIIDRRAFSAAP